MKRMLLVLISLLVIGCGTTRVLAPLPRIDDGSQAAKIHVVRPFRFVADGVSYMLQINGIFVLQMMPGHYTTFVVKPGKHILTLVAETFWRGLQARNASLKCRPGDQYYFKITPRGLTEITREAAEPLMKEYTYVPLEYEEE